MSGISVILSLVSSPGGVSGDQSLNGSAFIKTLMFNPGITSDSGSYTCVSTIIVNGDNLTASTNEILEVKSNQKDVLVSQHKLIFCISSSSPAEHHCESLHFSNL